MINCLHGNLSNPLWTTSRSGANTASCVEKFHRIITHYRQQSHHSVVVNIPVSGITQEGKQLLSIHNFHSYFVHNMCFRYVPPSTFFLKNPKCCSFSTLGWCPSLLLILFYLFCSFPSFENWNWTKYSSENFTSELYKWHNNIGW